METNRLRQFLVVYQTKNLRKAADLLGMSHSALSKSLKVLQTQLSMKLLDQRGRNIEITEEGQRFFHKAEKFLAAEDELVSLPPVKRAVIKIGTFEVFSTHLLGSVWAKYFGDSELELREFLPGQLERAIFDRQVDYGITYEPIPQSEIAFTLIGRIEMKVYARKGSFQELETSKIPFVAPISPILSTPTGAKGLDGWPEDKVKRTVRYRVDMMETGLALARSGSAAIFLPEFLVQCHNSVIADNMKLYKLPNVMLKKSVVRKVYLVARKSAVESSQYRILAKLIRNECS